MDNQLQTTSDTCFNHSVIQQNEVVIALHCSGGNSRQWQGLKQALGLRYEVHTPEHFGTAPGSTWSRSQTLTLADEAVESLRIIDRTDKKVHLIGHSYGGALAMHIALARPNRIVSLSLYEPCAFHLLPQLGVFAKTELTEISTIAETIKQRIHDGNVRGAMQAFVDYWNGEGAWLNMKPEHQNYLMEWAPNANHAFDALFSEEATFGHYRNLKVPTLLLQGEQSPEPAHVVSAALQRLLPNNRRDRMPSMGHMGPVTHAGTTDPLIAEFIKQHSVATGRLPLKRATLERYISVAA